MIAAAEFAEAADAAVDTDSVLADFEGGLFAELSESLSLAIAPSTACDAATICFSNQDGIVVMWPVKCFAVCSTFYLK